MEFLLNEIRDERISIITPSNPRRKRLPTLNSSKKNADKSLYNAITDKGVVADWREPDVIRVAPVPLYNSFMDVFRFVETLRGCLS